MNNAACNHTINELDVFIYMFKFHEIILVNLSLTVLFERTSFLWLRVKMFIFGRSSNALFSLSSSDLKHFNFFFWQSTLWVR